MNYFNYLTIRQKVYFKLIFSFFIFFILILTLGTMYLNSELFLNKDKDNFKRELNMLFLLVENYKNKIDVVIYDYSYWEETYRFTVDKNELFKTKELDYNETFVSAGIDIIQIITNEGELLYQREYPIIKKGIPKEFTNVDMRTVNKSNTKSKKGFYFCKSTNEFYYFVSYPIINSSKYDSPILASLVGWSKIDLAKLYPQGINIFNSNIVIKKLDHFVTQSEIAIIEEDKINDTLTTSYYLKDMNGFFIGEIELKSSLFIKSANNYFFNMIMFFFLISFMIFIIILMNFLVFIFRKIKNICLLIYEINKIGEVGNTQLLSIFKNNNPNICDKEKNEFEFLDCQLMKMVETYFSKGRQI